MKKKSILIMGVVGFFVIACTIAAVCFLNGQTIKPIKPLKNFKVNYNNYTFSNEYGMDSNGSALYYIENSMVNTVDSLHFSTQKKGETYNNVTSSFQISDHMLFYLNDDNYCVQKNLENGREKKLFQAKSFLVYKDTIFYLDSLSTKKSSVLCYDLNFDGQKTLMDRKDIIWYSIYGEKLYVIYNESYKEAKLQSFELETLERNDPVDLDFASPEFDACIFENYMIVYFSNVFYRVDIATGKASNVYETKDLMSMCGSKDTLFFSIQKKKHNGSITINKQSDKNGLWKMNIKSLEVEKITDTVFNKIVSFDNTYLFAQKEKLFLPSWFTYMPDKAEVFQINIDSKELWRIA